MKVPKYNGLVLPEHQQKEKRNIVRAIGYILRGAIALLCSFGMSRFVFDCMGAELGHGYILGICLALTALFCVMLTSKTLFAAGAVLSSAVLILALQSFGNIFKALRLIATAISNAWYRHLENVGYFGMSKKITDISDELSEIGHTEHELFLFGAVLIMLFLVIISVFSVIRRAKVLLLFGAYAALVTTAIYFEVADKPLGLLFMLASICAVVTLGLYDEVFCKRKSVAAALGTVNDSPDSRRELEYTLKANSALGGYAGAASSLVSLAVIALVIHVNQPMADMPKISHPAAKIQNYIIAMVDGGSGSSIINADSSVRESRKTTAEWRTSSGTRIFDVYSDTNIPVYLRSWTGKDYYSDAWHTASEDKIEEYHDMFGTGFSHEFLTSELIYAIDPTLYEKTDAKTQKSREFGFISSYVHIRKKTPSGALIYMPSYTDQRERLMRFGTDDKLYFGGYQNYYDGIFVSSGYIFADEYTVLARLGLPATEENVQNIALLVRYYASEYELLRTMRSLISDGADISEVRKAYDEMTADSKGITTVSGKYAFPTGKDSLSYRYAYVMNADERQHIDALTDNLALYNSYVYDNYMTVYEHFDNFGSLVKLICSDKGIDMRRDAATYDGRHRIASAIIEYLSKNMTYTLSPKAPRPMHPYSNGAATFLFDTKEGYCLQYASAAINLLRSAGIPARYAEGYISDRFTPNANSRSAPGNYTSHVSDSNAHAWVEVYYDYYGWITYEATTPYIQAPTPTDSDIVTNTPDTDSETGTDTTGKPDDTTAPSITDRPAESTNKIEPAVSNATSDTASVHQPPEETDNTGKAVIVVVIVAVTVSVFAVIVISLKRRADMARRSRSELILRASEKIPEAKERIDTARKLGEIIMKLLYKKKLSPEKAESASAFGERVDKAFGEKCKLSFSGVMSAISAAEFGDDITPQELMILADGAQWLEEMIISEAGGIKRVMYKYFGLMS